MEAATNQVDLEQRFKAASSELIRLINKRRHSWKLTSVMEWDDVSSIILAEIWKNWPSYDPVRPLDRWANTVITSRMKNLLRDHLFKSARPCLAATSYGNPCAYAEGTDGCRWTKSGVQDSSCGFYAKWLKNKQGKFAVSATLSIEAHVDETHNIQSDFVDYDGSKKVIDEKLIPLLSKQEARIYKLLFIDNLDMKQVGIKLRLPKQKNSEIRGYLIQRTLTVKCQQLAKQIIEEEGLCS